MEPLRFPKATDRFLNEPEKWAAAGPSPVGNCIRHWWHMFARDGEHHYLRRIEYSAGMVDALECSRCGHRTTDFMG